jgi:hypothetical protein
MARVVVSYACWARVPSQPHMLKVSMPSTLVPPPKPPRSRVEDASAASPSQGLLSHGSTEKATARGLLERPFRAGSSEGGPRTYKEGAGFMSFCTWIHSHTCYEPMS